MPSDTQSRLTADKTNFGTLIYSDKLSGENGGNMLMFVEYKYTRPTLNATFNPVETGTKIALPLPYDLSVPYAANWDQSSMGAWGEFVSQKGTELFRNADSIVSGNKNSISDSLMSSLKTSVYEGASAVGTDVVFGNRLAEVVGVGAGIVRNPFLAASFQGVQFREFNLQYKLYPKSKAEADTIEKIVKAFKYGMHPSYREFGGLKNALFNYPNIYKPAFLKPEHLFDFGFCVIKQINLSYHDQGAPIYIGSGNDKYPAFMSLQLSLQEIEIVTKETLTSGAGSTGGSR